MTFDPSHRPLEKLVEDARRRVRRLHDDRARWARLARALIQLGRPASRFSARARYLADRLVDAELDFSELSEALRDCPSAVAQQEYVRVAKLKHGARKTGRPATGAERAAAYRASVAERRRRAKLSDVMTREDFADDVPEAESLALVTNELYSMIVDADELRESSRSVNLTPAERRGCRAQLRTVMGDLAFMGAETAFQVDMGRSAAGRPKKGAR